MMLLILLHAPLIGLRRYTFMVVHFCIFLAAKYDLSETKSVSLLADEIKT